MQRLSYPTETVLSNKITRNRIALSFKDSSTVLQNHWDGYRIICSKQSRIGYQKYNNYLESLINGAVHFDHARNQGVADAVPGSRKLVGDPRILPNTNHLTTIEAPKFRARKTYKVIPVVVRVPVCEGQESKILHILLPEQRGKEFIVDYVLVFGIEYATCLLWARQHIEYSAKR